MKISSKIKTAIVAASALSITAIAAPASAGVVTFQTTGQWANAVGGTNVGTTTGPGAGDTTISWGRYSNAKSSYTFDAQSVGAIDLEDGETSNFFTLADFKHTNKEISGNGIGSVDLVFNTKIFVDGQYAADRTFSWTFSHEETANSGFWTCQYGGTGFFNCNDKVTVAYNGDIGSDSFQFGNDLYTLNLAGLQVKQGPNWVSQNTFITEEGKSNTAKIRAQLSMTTLTSAVPEPATWAMMLVGFFSAGSMLRSTRRKELMATAA